MKKIDESKSFNLQTVVTGMHLSPEFGLTFKAIVNDGFKIDKKIEMLISADTDTSVSKSIGLGIISFTDALKELKPDLLIILGDRYEILSASIAALILKIPIAHIHGGETTLGAFDEAIRHSISKMSILHFTACDEYRDRIIKMGEQPETVFTVGGMGVDSIKSLNLLNFKSLEKIINFDFGKKNVLVTFHPVTLEENTSLKQIEELLFVLNELNDVKIIFTLSNSDTNGRIINKKILEFTEANSDRAKVYTSMGSLNYLSTLQFVDCVVGNSSSGLLEAPTFKIGTLNIGDRQKGRIKADSVIDCQPNKKSIREAFSKLYSNDFQKIIKNTKNPYGDGNATKKIVKILKSIKFPNI